MKRFCTPTDHLSRRAFLKASLFSAGGIALPNWGGLFNSQSIAAEAAKLGKRCILLWMAGGPSQLDTFDMKPGRPVAGPFRPIASNVTGIQVCEYLPLLAKHMDKMCVIRSMSTKDPGHATGTYLMHTGYAKEETVKHPEMGAMVAKYLGKTDADLPSFIQIGGGGGESSPNAGAGYLGPAYQPFKLSTNGEPPENTRPYLGPDADRRRSDLLRFLEESQETQAAELQTLRAAQEKSWRLLRAKGVFDISQEWPKYQAQYGDTPFGRKCLLARRLIEAGVSFVECEQNNFDSHEDNFEWHKGQFPALDAAWSGLLQDLHERGLLKDTLVVWMGEFGRTPQINNRAGRDHFARAWSTVLCGGGVKTGLAYGETDADCKEVKDKPVSEGDFFATIYTALGVNPKARHFVGTRPIWAAPQGSNPVREILT